MFKVSTAYHDMLIYLLRVRPLRHQRVKRRCGHCCDRYFSRSGVDGARSVASFETRQGADELGRQAYTVALLVLTSLRTATLRDS